MWNSRWQCCHFDPRLCWASSAINRRYHWPSLVVERGWLGNSPGNIKLIPPDRSRSIGVIQDNGVVSPQRFHAAAVLVNNRRHDFIAQGIQLLRGPLLRHKVGLVSGECVNELVDCDQGIRGVVGANAESRRRRLLTLSNLLSRTTRQSPGGYQHRLR
jgi:hypothetical protein